MIKELGAVLERKPEIKAATMTNQRGINEMWAVMNNSAIPLQLQERIIERVQEDWRRSLRQPVVLNGRTNGLVRNNI